MNDEAPKVMGKATSVEDMTSFLIHFCIWWTCLGLASIWKPSLNGINAFMSELPKEEVEFLGNFGLPYSFVKIRPIIFFQLTEIKEWAVRLNPDLLTIRVSLSSREAKEKLGRKVVGKEKLRKTMKKSHSRTFISAPTLQTELILPHLKKLE